MTMAALVQTYPQQSGTVTMLQTRTGSNSGMMPAQPQPNQPYGSQQQRNSFHGMAGGSTAPMTYRGSAAPIQPYAFTSTPNLNQAAQWQQPHPTFRTSSSSAVPTIQTLENQNGYPRTRHSTNASMPNLPMNISPGGSRDDTALPPPGARRGSSNSRPQSAYFASSTVQTSFTSASPGKAQPDRYRRPVVRAVDSNTSAPQGHSGGSAAPSGSGMASVSHLYTPTPNANKERRPSPSNIGRPNSFYAKVPGSVDDMQLYRTQEDSKRIRRRSMPALDAHEMPKPLAALDIRKAEKTPTDQSPSKGGNDKDQVKTARLVTVSSPAKSSSGKNGSSESLVSSRSSNSRPSSVSTPICSHPWMHCPITAGMQPIYSKFTYADECWTQSANRNNVHTPTGNPAQLSEPSDNAPQDSPKLVNIPPRSSSSDAAKRVANPSPLSKPVTMDADGGKSGSSAKAPEPAKKPSYAEAAAANTSYDSPAVKQLAALNQKGGKLKSKTSRLRRALSFGSAAEFKKAGAGDGNKDNGESSAASKLQKDSPHDELDAEQARIAEQQEASGLGHNIYAGSRLFSGSTDNLSISSTASSASIMIRKMGRGMKKGGRSLAGLFRPKSIIGVPTAEGSEASQAAVSMVTVEAERERVNVNVDPNPDNGGGTGFPRLERNSLDATNVAAGSIPERSGSSGTDNSNPRKSIVGGDKERAEVLAAVRKGILKRRYTDGDQVQNNRSKLPGADTNGSTTPSPKPVERGPVYELPPVPTVSDSPISSAPSTPNDDSNSKRNETPVTIGNEDYFMTALRLRQDSKSAPGTPSGSKRNATFSPRIVFYDTWTGQEYDRRSEIATCNRLTPMLAQQIKEELNTFKMVRDRPRCKILPAQKLTL